MGLDDEAESRNLSSGFVKNRGYDVLLLRLIPLGSVAIANEESQWTQRDRETVSILLKFSSVMVKK